jgi:phosphonate transport system substrate-binding protein
MAWKKITVSLLLILGVCLFNSTGYTHEQKKTYSFGVVPQFEPRKLASIWLPIFERLEALSGIHLHLDGSPKIPDFEADFLQGRFDFAYMNPYHALLAARKQGYIPLVRDHGRKLFGILVVKKSNPIKSIKELDGKNLAFPAPNALGASLLMRAELARLFDIDITSKYVKTHSSVYLHVLLGRAEAGGGVMRTLKNQKPKVRDNLRIIHRTRGINPHPVVANKRVPEKDRQAIMQAFITMGKNEADRKLLAKIPIKKAGPASNEDYEELATWGLEDFYVAPNSGQ